MKNPKNGKKTKTNNQAHVAEISLGSLNTVIIAPIVLINTKPVTIVDIKSISSLLAFLLRKKAGKQKLFSHSH